MEEGDMSLNVVAISGNLGTDPELRNSASGTAILTLRIAVNERRKDQSGEWTDYTNWVDAVMFGSRAEAVSRFLSKGSKVAIEGKLRYSSWEKDGQRRSKLEVIVDEIEFMSRGQQQDGGGYGGGGYQPPLRPQAPAPAVDPWDEDIPFN